MTTRECQTVRRQRAAFQQAIAENADRWVEACGGTELPFRTRSGRSLHYMYNPQQKRHAYLDTMTDTILTDQEAEAFLERV